MPSNDYDTLKYEHSVLSHRNWKDGYKCWLKWASDVNWPSRKTLLKSSDWDDRNSILPLCHIHTHQCCRNSILPHSVTYTHSSATGTQYCHSLSRTHTAVLQELNTATLCDIHTHQCYRNSITTTLCDIHTHQCYRNSILPLSITYTHQCYRNSILPHSVTYTHQCYRNSILAICENIQVNTGIA